MTNEEIIQYLEMVNDRLKNIKGEKDIKMRDEINQFIQDEIVILISLIK